jgi:hypothetical protein
MFANEAFHGEPIRCTKVHAELDTYYARLYGLTRDELRYTPCSVDHKEVHSEDFPGETFRVLNKWQEFLWVHERFAGEY